MVEVCPDRSALIQGTTTLTYWELDQRSNAVARVLAANGARPEALVGLLMDRSPDLLIGLLAILKTGAAYVPLDPSAPAERLATMIDDCRPVLILTRASLVDLVPSGIGRMCIDTDPLLRGEAAEPLDVDIRAEHRAYVLYTSGSTGTPKGVEITHGSLANLIESFLIAPGLTANDCVLAHVTPSFDVSIIELILPMTTGARIVLAAAPDNRDGRALVGLMTHHGVTFVTGTPSFFRLLLGAGWTNAAGVTVFCGGEAMSRELADALMAIGATLWNAYGPTETTVWSSCWRVTPAAPIVIGDPVLNTDLHILDSALRPVPRGTIGELCIAGAGLARGYLNHPSLTAEKFPYHALGAVHDGRLYRTGDEARRRHDGGIEILGRVDRQIKIDGFRIEPGEIECALKTHAAVEHAIVQALDKAPGDTRLVAYIVHGANPPPREVDLVAHARRTLPLHMVPSAFVMIERAPMTSNGKLDSGALPAPDWRRAGSPQESAPPQSPIQHRLAAIWREILGLDRIGVDDNFFDIGGRSRLGAALFARIEREFGVRLPLATLFESPTIARLAEAIERSRRGEAKGWDALVAIRPAGSRLPLFFIHPVGGNVLAYRDLIAHIDRNVPCYGLQAIGLDGLRAPLTSVEAMAERYLHDIRSIQPRGPYRVCGFSFGGLVAFEIARLLRAAGEDIGLLALLDTDFPECDATFGTQMPARFTFFRKWIHPTLQRTRRHLSSLRRLGPAGYVRATVTKPASNTDDDQISPVQAANLRAALDYIPRPYDGTVTYFRANDSPARDDRRDRWGRVATSIDIIPVSGGHSAVRVGDQAAVVAKEISDRL